MPRCALLRSVMSCCLRRASPEGAAASKMICQEGRSAFVTSCRAMLIRVMRAAHTAQPSLPADNIRGAAAAAAHTPLRRAPPPRYDVDLRRPQRKDALTRAEDTTYAKMPPLRQYDATIVALYGVERRLFALIRALLASRRDVDAASRHVPRVKRRGAW